MVLSSAVSVFPPGIMFAVHEVFAVALMPVSLSFERDVVIGVSAQGKSIEPFYDIEEVEEDERHLFHLRGVNQLMVDEPWGQPGVGSTQQDAEEV